MLRTSHRGEPGAPSAADVSMPISPVITLAGVSKRFQNTVALHNVSATILPGQFVAIIGRSGAGKTTLLHCLSRTLTATAGSVRFGTCDLASLQGETLRQHRARVGMIYQQFNLVKRLCVCDNVLIGRLPHLRGVASWLALGRYFPAVQRDIALRCLEHVGLLKHAWQRTDTLSGGEQQRVAIAKVLAQQPQVILADEPVASLDLMNGMLVLETLRRVASEAGLTVIATLHHVEYARRYADRVLGLRSGELVFDVLPPALTDATLQSLFGDVPIPSEPPTPTATSEIAWVASS
jgi:phosphonate transport system ATP-binding protein